MTAEGAIAIVAAALVGSVALLSFGLDSAIEGLASVVIIWRFTGTRTLSPTAEAQRTQGRDDDVLPARPLHSPTTHAPPWPPATMPRPAGWA